MPLTRSMLREMALDEAQIDAIIDAHVEVRRAVEEQRDALRRQLEETSGERESLRRQLEETTGERESLRRQLEELTGEREGLRARLEAMSGEAHWQEDFRQLESRFEAYRGEVARRAAERAFRGLLEEERVPGRYHGMILGMTDLAALELDGDRLRDEQGVRERIRRDWGDFVGVERVRGLRVDAPPAMDAPGRLTAQEIMAIRDDARREREIAKNHEMFGF